MVMFILRRLGAGVVLLFVSTSLAFLFLYLGAGDIARNILGQQADAAAIAAKEAELGLDRPLLTQYLDWLGGAVTGDLGISWFTAQPVTEGIMARTWVTLSLVLGATVLTAVISVALGVWAAVRHGWVDKAVQVVSVLGFAIPNFLIAVGLVIVFAINMQAFEPTGYTAFTESPSGWVATVTLPIIALTIGGVATVAAQIRGSVMDALGRDYVRTLRSRGLPYNRVVYKHVLRNAAGPALAVLAVQFVGLFGGAIIVERVFAIPGLSDIGVTSTAQGDIPMVLGLVVATVVLVVVVNLVIDLLQGWLNPKVRLS
jgi:peptide/nickel transport system permease protein